MTLKFLSGIAVVLLAIVLQSIILSTGIVLNMTLATLIAFAFLFDFWELLVFDLFAVFILNWQPAPSVAIIIFALIPLAAFAFRVFTRWHGWIGAAIAIIAGFLIFYIAAAPALFLGHVWWFLMDLAAALIVGEIELSLMS